VADLEGEERNARKSEIRETNENEVGLSGMQPNTYDASSQYGEQPENGKDEKDLYTCAVGLKYGRPAR